MLLGAVQATWATDYITDVMIAVGKGNRDKKVKEGWTLIDKDLNAGAGGSYVYLLYKTKSSTGSSGTPITDFYLKTDKSPSSLVYNNRTYYPAPGAGGTNLDYGTRGDEKLYLFYTKDPFPDGRGVTGIYFTTTSEGAVPADGGAVGYDLNKNVNGEFIYMHVNYPVLGKIHYVERSYDMEQHKKISTTKYCSNFTRLTSNNTNDHTVLKDGWYVVDENVEFKKYLEIKGKVHIILVDGRTLNAKEGIFVSRDDELHIYGQEGDVGRVYAHSSSGPGIGGHGDTWVGTINIYGGIIDAQGSKENPGIGGSKGTSCAFQTVRIYGGTITAQGGRGGAGIGSGKRCYNPRSKMALIYGGTVTATGGSYAAGIGGGSECDSGGCEIYSATVTAQGGMDGPGIGSGNKASFTADVVIYDSHVEAYAGGGGGEGIGIGSINKKDEPYSNPEWIGDVYITNSHLTAVSNNFWTDGYSAIRAEKVHIDNSTVFAQSAYKAFYSYDEMSIGDGLMMLYSDKGDFSIENYKKTDKETWRDIVNKKKNILIQPCDHVGAIYRAREDGTHILNCEWCGNMLGSHTYAFQNDGYYCTFCKAEKPVNAGFAQALWCDAAKTLYFLAPKKVYKVGETYDGQTITNVWSGDQVSNTGTTAPGWNTIKGDATEVVIDASFVEATPQSLYQWFDGFTNLTTIDVNNIDVSEVSNTSGMFQNCGNVKTIFCDNTWSGIANSTDMFTGCTSLKGSMGTVSYSPDNANDITFANSETGYFTKTDAVYTQALWCDGNKTLYFACPAEPLKVGETYNGQTVNYVWSGAKVFATGDIAPGWSTVKGEATKVVFDASFAKAQPTSLVSWFSDFTNLTTINLNGLDVSKVENAASMFSGCTGLMTIYCDNPWTIAAADGMFTGCSSLMGAVAYSTGQDNISMANPTTGYFTKKWKAEVLNDGITVDNLTPNTNEDVTISGEGDSGKGIAAIIVTGKQSGTNIPVTDNGDGTWSFTMPAEDVSVREKIDIAIYDGKDNSEVLKQNKGKTVNITYDRILKATDNGDGTWTSKAYTVCLPYEKDLQDEFWADKVRLYELAIVNDAKEFVFNGVPSVTIEAGKPYLVVVDKETVKLNAEGVKIQALPEQDENTGVIYPSVEAWQNQDNICGWWRGTYQLIDNEESTQLKAFILNSDGKWRGINNDTEGHRKAYVPTFRAYYQPKEFTDYWDYTTKFDVLEGGGDPYEIWYKLPGDYEGDSENGVTGIQPVIHTIDLDGTNTYYDLQGRKLAGKPTQKGIYINNGNKIINK